MLSMRRNADLRTLLFIGVYFALVYVIWNQYETLGTIPFYTLWWLTWYFSWVGAVAVHNTVHCPVFYNKTANKLLHIALSLVYGHPTSSYVPGHNLSHHQNTQTPRDMMRTSKVRFKWHFLNGILFGPAVAMAVVGAENTYFDVQRKKKQPIYKQFQVEKFVTFTVAAMLIILNLRKWVVCVFLPHLLSSLSIVSLNMLQHDGCDDNHKYNHSRNFVSPILNFFAYNNGYHTIHHMHPGWHWSTLPQKHKELVEPFMHKNLAQPSILLYIFKTFIFPGIRIDYLGNPIKLPPPSEDQAWYYETTETYSNGDQLGED